MRGLMMELPLLISSVLKHAAENHSDTEIVSRREDGELHRYTYVEAWHRAQRLAHALVDLGLCAGERIGTLAWNGYRHLEIYYAVSGSGGVCHTINPRLLPSQIGQIINHAEDAVLFVDLGCVSILEKIEPAHLATVRAFVVLADPSQMPLSTPIRNLYCYESLLAPQSEHFEWPVLDENRAAALCYTSGTTGDPKGVLYSHRSCVLHAMMMLQPDVFDLSCFDTIAPVVPMFHVNAWGLPYAAPMVGAKLVLPGPRLDGASLYDLFQNEGVTFTAGVPTVWLGLLDWMAVNGRSLKSLKRVVIGGAALTTTMMDRFGRMNIDVRHAWGMTETSPVGSVATLKPKHQQWSGEDQSSLRLKQGRPMFGVEYRVIGSDGQEIARDNVSVGALHIRGPWVARGYFRVNDPASGPQAAWFDTGDVVNIDADGFIHIVDRAKDLIKSGGEWINSLELEAIAQSHTDIIEAAAIARADPQWGERPVLVVRLKPGSALTRDDIINLYSGKVPKWSVPDDVVIVPQIPHTATGKISKKELRLMIASSAAE